MMIPIKCNKITVRSAVCTREAEKRMSKQEMLSTYTYRNGTNTKENKNKHQLKRFTDMDKECDTWTRKSETRKGLSFTLYNNNK